MNLRAVQSLPEEGLPGPNGGRAQKNALDRAALVWALSALAQAFRIPFDENLVAGQMPPPYGIDSIAFAADLLGLRAAWERRPASALRKLAAPFLVLLSPALREPHPGPVAGRESLASLDSAAPNPRLAFLLRMEGDRVALFEQGQASDTTSCPSASSKRAMQARCCWPPPKISRSPIRARRARQARNSVSAGSSPNC